MKEIIINNKKYNIIVDEKEALNTEILSEKITEYYNDYDYIVGDWAYGKIRLKGFFKSDNKQVKKYNDIKSLENYLKECCAHGCKWFQIERIKD